MASPPPRRPILLLPPAEPGRPPRRFVVRPARVYALLLLVLLLGAGAAGGAVGWFAEQQRLRSQVEVRDLAGQLDALRAELEQVRSSLAEALATPAEEPPESRSGPDLQLALPTLNGEEPEIKVALLRSREPVAMEGTGLSLELPDGTFQPLPSPAVVRPGGKSLQVEGAGRVQSGSRVVSRGGTLTIAGREYPGSLELHLVDEKVLLINELPLERYIQGVVSSELPASWSLEAKKAQAVAARTYALMQRATAETPHHLESTVLDQVYRGTPPDPTTRAAVTATHGEVLTLEGTLVSAFYHSTCGGRTEGAHAVWPDRPAWGNEPAECGFCERAPAFRWSLELSVDRLLDAARADGHEASAVRKLHIRRRTRTERVAQIDLVTDQGTVSWSGNRFRELVGWNKVKSALFEHEVRGAGFRLQGRGAGHGVGLCQWGAQGMATAGHDYRDVLSRYYPQSKVQRLY